MGREMDWRELVARWDEDPAFDDEYRRTYPYHDVADAVVELRAKAGLTQSALAEAVGTTQSVIARLESGKQAVRIDLLTRIADALEMTWRPVFESRMPTVVETVNAPDTRYAGLNTYIAVELGHWAATSVVHAQLQHGWISPDVGIGEPVTRVGIISTSGAYQVISERKTDPFVDSPLPAGNRQSTLALAS